MASQWRIMGVLGSAVEMATASSPIHFTDCWKAPVLFIHGDADYTVSFRQTLLLQEALHQKNVDLQTLVLPGEVHEFLLFRSWLEAYQAAAEFFRKEL